MQNTGEEIAGVYLKEKKNCDFIQYNVHNPDIQGEIDVIGIDIGNKKVYICEVAIHLITGLKYTKNKKPDNVNRFTNKFEKNIAYANEYIGDYQKTFMLWSPIVKSAGENAKYNQLNNVKEVEEYFKKKGINLELILMKNTKDVQMN